MTRSPSTREASTTGARALPARAGARCRAEPKCGARSRVYMAIVGGCASGIMGLTGLVGFIVFFISSFLMSAALYLMMDRDPRPYFKSGSDVLTDGVMPGIMSYILFWTLFYDVVHIY